MNYFRNVSVPAPPAYYIDRILVHTIQGYVLNAVTIHEISEWIATHALLELKFTHVYKMTLISAFLSCK